jgi:hypothetical protein
MCVLPWSNTFVSVGQVRINFSSFWRTSHYTSAIQRSGNWKKVREQVLEYGLVQLEEVNKCI